MIERMQFRKHYKCVGEKGLNMARLDDDIWKQITPEAICEYAEPDENGQMLKPSDIGVKKYIITNGLKGDHPLNHVKFFDKKGHKKQSYVLADCKKESMLPKENRSWTVRCFVKPLDKFKLIQAEKAFQYYCGKKLGGMSRQVIKQESQSQAPRKSQIVADENQ